MFKIKFPRSGIDLKHFTEGYHRLIFQNVFSQRGIGHASDKRYAKFMPMLSAKEPLYGECQMHGLRQTRYIAFRFNQRAMQRRSLIGSLSEEERAFVEAGKPQSTRKTVPPVQQPVATEEQPVQKRPAPAKKLPPSTALPPVLVSQTYRLPADLVKELIKVAVSRKLDRTAPWSQQDIVAEAIRDWLTK
ncbi:MAG TPA: hypothetical protein VE641_16565, partial [Chthoniobacterales bacterium]|nr:hypothetical protein [Chthoniobacterales bacterium]